MTFVDTAILMSAIWIAPATNKYFGGAINIVASLYWLLACVVVHFKG